MGGRGSSSGISANGKPTVRISMQFFGRKQTSIHLPKKEYGKIMHEVNTLYNSKYSKNQVIYHYSGNYKYILRNNGFDDYIIVAKNKIK